MQVDLLERANNAFYIFKHYFDNHSIEMQQRDATITSLRSEVARLRARSEELTAKLKALGVNEEKEEFVDPSILEHVKE